MMRIDDDMMTIVTYRVMQGTGLVVLPTEQARYGRLPGEDISLRDGEKYEHFSPNL